MENAAPVSTKIEDKNQTTATNAAAQKSADKILHEKFALYGKNAREWMRKCALLLPEIEKREIWRKRGFPNIYEYARILAGMSANAVNDALRILKKAEDKPALQRVIEEKGISAVRPIITIATTETAGFWAEKAREMNKNTLEAYVREFRKADLQAKLDAISCPRTEYSQNQNLFPEINLQRIEMYIKPEIAEKLQKLKGQTDWSDLMEKFIKLYEEKLEQNHPQSIENASRYVSAKIKNYALAKTNGTCAFPGCTKPYEILHHTKRYALTHAHNPDQLTPLCKAHERLAHLGLIENEERPPERWCLRMLPGRADKNSEKFKIDQKVLKYRAIDE